MKHLILLFTFILSLTLWGCNGTGDSDNEKSLNESELNSSGKNDSLRETPSSDGVIMNKSGPKAPEGNSTNTVGRTITFDAGTQKANAFLVPSKMGKSKKYLLLFHEWWGLNEQIKRAAEQYATELRDVNVIALDLYDGKVARTPEVARALVDETSKSRIIAIINGAITYMGDDANYATLGWCYGGGWALQTGILHPKNNIGIVMYYGEPEKEEVQIKKIQAPVQGFFGIKDKVIPPSKVTTFAAKMKKLNKTFNYKEYDAAHAFANPSNPDYNRKATADARRIALDFLNKLFE